MDGWMIVPGNALLSALILFVIVVPFLYAARVPMHGFLRSVTRAISGPLRLGSRWMMHGANEMRKRNKAVLLAHGREELEQTIEREFERIAALVERELRGFPTVQRKLNDEITRIEEDYKKCAEVPPPPPEWAKAVAAIAKIKPGSDGLVEKILEDISKSMEKIYDKTIAEYRRSYQGRHNILKGFAPFWRSLSKSMETVGRDISGLQKGAATIDNQMDKYEHIKKQTDMAEQTLSQSAGVQFAIATIVMVVALGGALVNFKLIALPMSAMVGAGDYLVGDLRAADVAALVIIFIEATMGLFLMESLRITHLFPRIGNLPDRMRRRFMWVAFTILLILAGVEVGLAVMRDWIVQANINLIESLNPEAAKAAAVAAATKTGWVGNMPIIAQMILGFVLPFALAFLAIPLESFIYSARTVLGIFMVALFRTIGFTLRIVSNIFKHVGTGLTMLYDVVIFLPLLIEKLFRKGGSSESAQHSTGVTSFPKRSRTATGEHII